MADLIPARLAFELPYTDKSGAEILVKYDQDSSRATETVTLIVLDDAITFDRDKLDWVITVLQVIRYRTK